MALIKIDLNRVVTEVDRRILGGFAEHVGRCIYGGVYEEGSPLADEHGFRTDVIEAVRRLKPTVLRWPGGNFASGYHWVDGIGPKDQRPRRMDLSWHAEESNRFGTDEFLTYCAAVGAEPYICLNMGTGTVDEAQAWMEYCNGTGRTEWADRRRENGHEEPYKVRYWGLGNELYGWWQIGQKSAEDYVKDAREYAKVLSWTDPEAELVSCGELGWTDWDVKVIDGLAAFVRWHSIHLYTGSDDYWQNLAAPLQAERALRIVAALVEKTRYNQRISHPVNIALDEWNVLFRYRNSAAALEGRYSLADALAVATFVHAFVRYASIVKMANLAQLVNVIAPIVTNSEGLFLQSIYHPLRLFADHLGPSVLDVYVDCDRQEISEDPNPGEFSNRVTDLGPFAVLDAIATFSEADHKLMLSVINRSPDTDVTAELSFSGTHDMKDVIFEEVNGEDWDSANSFDHPDAVSVSVREGQVLTDGTRYRFPAHSMTMLSAICE